MSLPSAKSARDLDERERVKKAIARRNLVGLANDTKWDELIAAMRDRAGWRPRFRFKCVDGVPIGWDSEWCYHLPFPMISAEWFDLGFIEVEHQGVSAPKKIVDHSDWIESLLAQIGLDFKKGKDAIRIFGYSPRSLELFED